jgi:hypothetical protein
MKNNVLASQEPSPLQRFESLMDELGFTKCLSLTVHQAALELHEDQFSRENLLRQTKIFFTKTSIMVPYGVDELPTVWLGQLPGILWGARKQHWKYLPYFIRNLALESGSLRIDFVQEHMAQRNIADTVSVWNQLRVMTNLSLKPSIWRPLSVLEERTLWIARPDLRKEIFEAH